MAADNSTILVIEDEWTSRRFLTEALSDIAKVRCVASASEAYSALGETADDIAMVIADVIMRGQSGLDFLTYLRNDLGRKDIPVIIYTAHGSADMERLAFESGATEFMIKPVALPKLRMRVAAIFDLTRGMAGSVSSPVFARQLLDPDAFTKVLRNEAERALVGGYSLLLCRAHCDGFLPAGGSSHGTREVVLDAVASRHYDHFRQSFAWVWQEPTHAFGLLTMSHTVDSALRDSRLYRAWLSDQVMAECGPESDDHIGLGMLVYDFSAMDADEREEFEVNATTSQMITRIDKASRAAASGKGALVTVMQDVITL